MRKVLYLLGEPLDIQTLYEQSIYIVLRFKNGEVRKDMTGFESDLAVWLNQGTNLITGSTQSGAITLASTANDAILDEMRIFIDFIGTNTACPAPYSYNYRLNIEKDGIDTFALNGKFVILDVAPDDFQIEDVQPSTVTFVQTSVSVSVQTMDVAQLRNEALAFRNQAEVFKDSASNSATASASSATLASQKATDSANSATQSANSATTSANSATASANSATQSSNSATASANSATNAQASADSATASAQQVGNIVNRELQILPVKAGSAMNIGTPVYISSADGTNIIVSPASSASEATSSKVVGLLMQMLANNGLGSVVTGGKLAGLNTSTATLGDAVWLGSTAGTLIYGLANKPKAPQHLVFLGVVSRVHATNGEITVKVQNGFEMDEIHNYLESGLQDGDVVQYDGASGLYKNKQLSVLPQNIKNSTASWLEKFTTANATVGSYVNGTGVITALAGTNVTDFIPLVDGVITTNNIFSFKYALYTADKVWISTKSGASGVFTETLNLPSNAKFIRINYNSANSNSLMGSALGYLPWLLAKKEQIEGLTAFVPRNLIPNAIFGNDGYYLSSNNVLLALANSQVSEFVRINPSFDYAIDINTSYTALGYFYDKDKNPISSLLGSASQSTGYKTFTSPSNAYWIRINKFVPAKTTGIYVGSDTQLVGKYSFDFQPDFRDYYMIPLPNVSVGTIAMNTRDRNTFVGAYNYVIDKLLISKPKAKVVFVTHYANDGTTKNSHKLLVDTQKALAKYWGAQLINLADSLQFINRDSNNLIATKIPDSIHPAGDYNSTTGRSENIDNISAFLVQELRGIFLEWTGKKVAWYGTSIPDGVPYPTIDNANYPIVTVNKLGGICYNYSKASSLVRLAKYDGTANPENSSRDQFSNDDVAYQTGRVTYLNSMVNLVGTASEPDLFVFDFGYNDYYADKTDFNLMSLE